MWVCCPTVRPALTALAASLSLATPARAGEVACWYDRGVLVAPASVLGVVGDFILDTGQARTELAETQAQTAGFEAVLLSGPILLAGEEITAPAVAVSDLDVRAGLFPTPIAGVIGADVLRAYVVDVSYRPCRLALHRPRTAARTAAGMVLPLRWADGLPTISAAVSDGPRAWRSAFVPSTGADRAVRLSDGAARAPGAAKPGEVYPYGVIIPHLRAVSLGERLAENVEAGLVKADALPGAAGMLGPGLLDRYRLRFDFPGGRLLLTPNEKGPPETGGP